MKTKYTFLSLLETFGKIEIPRIQRSYAQGRENEKIIRKSFLNNIMDTLEKNEKELCLDFIYGTIEKYQNEESKFIPIDGQQRLTTLYLLYWYMNNYKNNIINNSLRKFTYETRESSKEFCENLSSHIIDISEDGDNISKKIKNETWYLAQWDNDPTIKAMLIMLDAIEENLKGRDKDKIKRNLKLENEKIYFYSIEIKTFGNADELYVKMNSRGKKLTTFENFKSKLENYIEKDMDNKTLKKDFEQKIDNEWLNYFWNRLMIKKNGEVNEEEVEEIDNWLMNLFMTIYENEYALKLIKDKEFATNKEEQDNIIKSEIKEYDNFILTTEDRRIDFENLKLKGLNDITVMQGYYILEYFRTYQNCRENDNFIKFVKKEDVLDKIMNVSKTTRNDFRPEKVEFYVMCKYIYKIKNEMTDEKERELSKILYFVRNIVENVYMDSEERYCNMIRMMDYIIENSFKSSIFQYISELTEKDIENIKGISKDTKYLIEGEIKKIKHIILSQQWEKEIITIDENLYLKGNTQFLFEFIENKKNEENISDSKKDLELYRDYAIKINTIFKNLVTEEDRNSYEQLIENKEQKQKQGSTIQIDPICNNNEYNFKRALLTIGNYLFIYNGRYSFLICSDKYQSWKKLLTVKEYEQSRDVLRKLLDKINLNGTNNSKENIEVQMKNIVKEHFRNYNNEDEFYPKDKNGQYIYKIGNWREYCIRYPKLIETVKLNNYKSDKLGNLKSIDENIDNSREIMIIKNKNISDSSWSFYTYALKYRLQERYKIEDNMLEYIPNTKADSKYIKYISKRYGEIGVNYSFKEINNRFNYYIKINKKINEENLANLKIKLNKELIDNEKENCFMFEYNSERELIEDFNVFLN